MNIYVEQKRQGSCMNYTNPILRGFHPDPSICRVGNDYYLVVSSFEYFPGIPVYHSTDLVNWTQIGNCVTHADEFHLEKVGDSGGIWAPTIRRNDGVFYVTATLDGYGNFIITAEDPSGPWSSPVWVREVGGIDPSLYFEDGHAYYYTNESLNGGDGISLEEIDPKTGKVIGSRYTLWSGIGARFTEAPHLYKIGDWYYLMAAEGGTFFNHMENIARSRNLLGPYESCPDNPILTNMCDPSWQVQCSGHADLFEDAQGNWWAVHLGIRLSRRTMTHLGRETFLTPVTWKDGWPMCGHMRHTVLNETGPLSANQKPLPVFQADLSRTDWEPEWIFLRKPDMSKFLRREGEILLYPSADTLKDKLPTYAAVRPLDFECEVECSFDYDAHRQGSEAGLAIRLDMNFHIVCTVGTHKNGRFLHIILQAEDIRHEVANIPIPAGTVTLLLTADKLKYMFSYSIDESEPAAIGQVSTRFVATELSGRCFTGTVMGLYTASQDEPDTPMIVRSFTMRPTNQ